MRFTIFNQSFDTETMSSPAKTILRARIETHREFLNTKQLECMTNGSYEKAELIGQQFMKLDKILENLK